MAAITEHGAKRADYYGVDTELYSDERGQGLLSIQVANSGGHMVFSITKEMEDWTDDDIRFRICERFCSWMERQKIDLWLYFFNLRFDFSQMEKYMVDRYEPILDPFEPKKGQIGILQSDSKVFQVKVRLHNGRLAVMRDLMHITQSSLDASARAFVGRGKIEMTSKMFPKREMSDIVKKYAVEDALLTWELGKALREMEGVIMTQTPTVAGLALREFRRFLAGKAPPVLMGMKVPPIPEPRQNVHDWMEITKNRSFAPMRPHVRGGNVAAFRTGITEGDVLLIDIHSAHPSQMVKKIPYGIPLEQPPKGDYIEYLFPKGQYLLKEGGLPCVMFPSRAAAIRYSPMDDEGEGELDPGEWANEFYLDGSYGFWEDEWRLIKSQYIRTQRFNSEWTRYYFRAREDPWLKPWIEMLYLGKQTQTGAKSTACKYLMNGLYGKFLQKDEGWTIQYVKGDDGDIRRQEIKDFGRGEVYLPLGSWIASMTRCEWIRTAISIGPEHLLYGDTDSLMFEAFPNWESRVELGSQLGQWGLDKAAVRANIVGRKTYQLELRDGRIVTKCGGLPMSSRQSMGFGTLFEGAEIRTVKAVRDKRTMAIGFRPEIHTVSSKPGLFMGGLMM